MNLCRKDRLIIIKYNKLDMPSERLRPSSIAVLIALICVFSILLACARSVQSDRPDYWSPSGSPAQPSTISTAGGSAQQQSLLPPTRTPGGPVYTPTPDPPHDLPAQRTSEQTHVVQAGDTLGEIARTYSISLEELIKANNLSDPNRLDVGQVLVIPLATQDATGPDFKIIPDSELIYGPYASLFDLDEFIHQQGGYLDRYAEEVGDETLSGSEIVRQISQDYSVNPRLLLAILEYQSGWLSQPNPKGKVLDYPIGIQNAGRKGLFYELSWAANNLNRGYYLWRANAAGVWVLPDGILVPVNPTINAGTAGVQHMFSYLDKYTDWQKAVTENGLFATYSRLFGYPFDLAFEPLLPATLVQPPLLLPFAANETWSFTGGPHGGWGDGSAWAALDFAPPGEALGCTPSNSWVTAVADGLVLRASDGIVVQDLDGDGLESTGWTIFYLHIESRQRVAAGAYLQAGDPLGHPSCEGGVSNGTHLHIARRYNGEWIPADRDIPFILDGWVSYGAGKEYDGYLSRGGKTIEAYAGRSEINEITR